MIPVTVRPVLDRLFILQSEGEKETSGLIIPDSEQVKPCKGVVVAVGIGWRASTTGELIPMTVKVGDTVIYDQNTSTTVEIEGVDYIHTREANLLTIL